MRNVLIFLMVLHFNFVFSQSEDRLYKISYDIKYLIDTNGTDYANETGLLFIANDKSYFLTSTENQRDSLVYFDIHPTNYKKNIESKVLRVVKDYDEAIVNHYIQFMPGPMLYTSDSIQNLNWEILSDTMSMMNYKCQKASLSYRGKKWIAWFTTDVPISDGPYKFCGLPGLIVSIEDTKGTWLFNLLSLEVQKNRFLNLSHLEKAKKISYKDLLKESDSWKYKRIERVEATGMIKYDIQERPSLIRRNLERIQKNNNDIEIGLIHY